MHDKYSLSLTLAFFLITQKEFGQSCSGEDTCLCEKTAQRSQRPTNCSHMGRLPLWEKQGVQSKLTLEWRKATPLTAGLGPSIL